MKDLCTACTSEQERQELRALIIASSLRVDDEQLWQARTQKIVTLRYQHRAAGCTTVYETHLDTRVEVS